MDLSLERDSSALGSLFQQIINDMKNTSPLWEDFVAKASKLHTCLRAAIQAIAAYLDAFQKIADAATNSRGASKEIGTALTRVCLRHKAVETRLKTFTSAIMDCLVQPLQDKIEDWKRTVATIDKDHAKEYKRCRSELKKRSSDTLRLQKKARKGQTDGLQSLMDSHMQDVTLRRAELEEVEKKSLRSAMVEERLRYCSFVHMLQPVVHEECEVMSELGHLQEAMQSIALVTKEPNVLPQASEELIHDAKASINLYPESPGGGSGSQGGGCSNSLGSRKSSVCSISSMNSSGSSNSPGHHHYQRSLSQFVTPAIRLKPGESSDSGFCSSPALTTQASTSTNQTHAVSTWPPHSQDAVDTLPPTADRPHTISTAYEKGHQRPPLTVYTFQNPETIHESSGSGNMVATNGGSNGNNGNGGNGSGQNTPATQKSPAATLSRPPLPVRCSSLERPLSAQSNHRQGSGNLLQRQCPSPIPAHITKELSAAHHAQQQQQQQSQQQQQQSQQQQQQAIPPTYVNMSELANMAALKLTNQQQQQQQQQQLAAKPSPPPLQQQSSIDSIGSQHSNDSSTGQLHHQQHQHHHHHQHNPSLQLASTRSHSISSSVSSNSHPSIDSAVAASLMGHHNATNSNSTTTTTPSSGSSTPQNHYSPLLTQSPTSTAAGTPSAASSTGLGFVYQVNSPTPPTSEILKITEQSAGSVDGGESATTETDERSRASVLQKASMFEKAAAAATSPPLPVGPIAGSVAPNGGRRSEEMRAAEQQEMDKSFEDSIQALNNLIGELDSFQREIDEGKGKHNNSSSSNSNNNNSNNNGSLSSSDNNNILATSNIDLCAISNQTNSSGCGTDISDTNSDEPLQQHHEHREQHDASDSELSRCYVSETSSLTAGYENPTFAHLSREDHPYNNGSVGTGYAGASDTISLCASSDSVCLGQPRHAYVDTCSDNGSAVVVIYDHQIPNTPDVEFVKQNSEIVVLRTKDPQSQLQLHEMRELQQLPTNLAGSPESSPDSTKPSMQPPTATVAPAKQRLSSFRASSEQQLQLLGRSSPQRGKDKVKDQQPGTIDEPTVKRTTLPPKPTSLSIFNGPTPPPTSDKPLIPRKSDFKADLDAKIRRQKLKVQQQLQQKQQQQQQQQQEQPQQLLQQHQQQATHSPQSPPTARNCNVTNQAAVVITSSSSSSTLSIPSTTTLLNSNPNHRMPNITATFNHKTPTASEAPPSSSSSSSISSSSISPSVNALAPAVPARPPQPQPQTQPLSTPPIPSQAKPCITPRPASLSSSLGGGGGGGAMGGGSTRIARRSSINQAKPPPPVRRSSSVTPSPNATMGPPPTNLHYQQQAQLSSSSEHLPPPPAFMLDAHHNTAPPMPMPPLSLPSPPTSMLSSALKVSETVRALAAMRHQPASPVALRRMQQQQQHHPQQPQQPQQPFIQSLHNFSPSNDETTDYEAYYNSYMELHAYAEAVNQGQRPYNGQQQQTQSHPPPHHNHQQPLPPTPPPYHAPPQADAPSFRTSSPASGGNNGGGIYAQPKLVNSMSSFRTSSPSPNGHAAAALPPTQPKANPNLIAQLNARLNSNKQHTTDGGGGIYGNHQQQQQQHQQPQSGGVGGDSIYMRGGGMSHLPQQQHFDDYATNSTNIEKTGSIRAKTKAEFLENLNAKLAKQGMSGRAFAVRNLINSKALPDPRICHESLMDQIKRGATLKRNQKINDRSAPKIH